MNREAEFLIYCMERYRYFKGLSGERVASLFEQHKVFAYLTKHFMALHTQGDHCIVQDIDDYILSRKLEQTN